ncbi:TolC family outer membrane protein [Sphingomonas morindae]|uniref:TolC family outer membrane protein n=1 Tax=Sphingomonas morindae TaxID=1541170 RepID=A0ABY4X6D6_9SPHN|nr:TolC family outer membrane protein [Sphingomonas morindae]USI72453.1 TolC family outer membrane protein [Sphingomonas morindae]
MLLLTPAAASALTLQEALAAAYATNPSLDAQRASLRATDEDAAIARGQGRPQLGVSTNYTYGLDGLRALAGYNRALLAGVQGQLPLFQGGRVRNAVRAADKRSAAGREALRGIEGDTLVEAVTAYVDVLRDRAILELNRQNVAALNQVYQSSQARLKAGDVTRTDLAQTSARIQQGGAGLAGAESDIIASEESFRRVIGLDPVQLAPPPALPPVPATVADAVAGALAHNGALASYKAAAEAAQRDVSAARGARLPTLSVGGASTFYSYRDRFAGIGNVDSNASQVSATLTLPLYQGGTVAAQVRQAQDRLDEAEARRRGAERQVDSAARAAFAAFQAAQRTITAYQQAVTDNEDAAKGVRIEANGGERQVLDILNAELELLNSRIGLARAQHDAYVAAFQLLNVMGLADAHTLGADNGHGYNPMVNFRHATHAVSDFSGRPSRARMGYGPLQPAADQP